MVDEPWTLIVDGSGNVTERKLANHAAGVLLAPTIHVVSNEIDAKAGTRTVVMTRSLVGANKNYFTFHVDGTNGLSSLNILLAIGSGPEFGYHKDKEPTMLHLLPVGSDDVVNDNVGNVVGACVCPESPKPFGQATGSLVYHANSSQPYDTGSGAVGFSAHKCKNWPATDLMNNTNPTCDIRHYKGGQWACHHMWSLLDADQEIPWTDQPITLHHKYRFWVQPFNETYHQKLLLGESMKDALLIGSPFELDVPKCQKNIPGCSLHQDGITWIHTVIGNRIGSGTFTALNFHCHAPTCLSMAVYACEKNISLNNCNADIGQLLCMQRPVYGGTGNSILTGTRFDEPGYIAIPDCFWGSDEFGLESPINVTNLPLHIIKTSNATWGHYGEMAGGQPWVY